MAQYAEVCYSISTPERRGRRQEAGTMARQQLGDRRISLIHRHPWTKKVKVVVSQWYGGHWQLIRSSGDAESIEDESIQRFLSWARERYPTATFKEWK
jgi:hypothetical protein